METNYLKKIDLYSLAKGLKNSSALYKLEQCFFNYLGLKAIAGAEIEFYLNADIDFEILKKKIGYKFIKEKGKNQWEVNFKPNSNLSNLVEEIINFKLKASDLGCSFVAKPFEDDYGSALHIHINFLDLNNRNLCEQASNLDLLANCLCRYLDETFIIFAPNDNSYLRFDSKFMAPTNISYGSNNRSTAIRIPDSIPKRLEHRVAGSDADPYLVIYTIFKAIYLSLHNNSDDIKIQKIYGNAFDNQYKLKSFPKNLSIASRLFNENFFKL